MGSVLGSQASSVTVEHLFTLTPPPHIQGPSLPPPNAHKRAHRRATGSALVAARLGPRNVQQVKEHEREGVVRPGLWARHGS